MTIDVQVRDVTLRYVWGYWGKARPTDKAAYQWHPLAWHCLDVAACVQELLRARPGLLRSLVRALGPDATIEGAIILATLLAVAHDVGKFGERYQAQSPDTCALIGSAPLISGYARGDWRHDNVGLIAWLQGGIAEALGLDMDAFDVMPKLASASACHHGRPTDAEEIKFLSRAMSAKSVSDACDFLQAFRRLLNGEPSIPIGELDASKASFILAGVISVADWVASQSPYASPDPTMASYWERTQKHALIVVAKAGLHAARPRNDITFASLFPGKKPTPLQLLADSLVFPAGPFLIMVDEMTGGGKTEAEDVLVGRMMAAGHGEGMLLSMPTMVTADEQTARHAAIRSLLFDDAATPTMMIAHSGHRDGLMSESDRERQAWLADDRRRRLLSDLCVGTIDQALLAALPTKFAVVRLLGLIGKVLVVDEAHSYDDYTSTLLEALLEFHAAMGGSAILLSATLPRSRKLEFATSFARGAGLPPPKQAALDDPAYPLLTMVSKDGVRFKRPKPAPRAPRDTRVVLIHSVAEAERLVLKAARSGQCVAWIRNTVDQAIETGRSLITKHEDVTILHSRFPEHQREQITKGVLSRFGKHSRSSERQGGVVVATSVIEESLDLDFDMVVVDLKTIDGVLQARGRHQRHSRDAVGNPLVDGAQDQRTQTPMIVVAPDPSCGLDREWYSRLLGRAAFVDPDTGALWRTARVLVRDGWIRYSTMRRLIEDVWDPERSGIETPQVFDFACDRTQARSDKDIALVHNAIRHWKPDIGYVFKEAVWDDGKFPTREGISIEIVLVSRNQDGILTPLYADCPWTAGRLRLRIDYADRLLSLERETLPLPLRRACPHSRAVEVTPDSDGPGFQLTAFAGLEFSGG